MSAQHEATSPCGYFARATENLAQHLQRHPIAWPSDQIEPEQRCRTHRVDVAQRIGNGNGTPGGRIVYDGSEEVHRSHERALGRQCEHCGVVSSGGVDQDPGVPDGRQMAQDLRQIGGAELTGSTRAVREGGEPNAGLLVDGSVGHGTSVKRIERSG